LTPRPNAVQRCPIATQHQKRAAAVLELHAHVKAADRYLEKARRRASVPLRDGDDGDAPARPEGRSIRQTTRATAAVILNAAGNSESAHRILRTPPGRN
jgi:hypothetical protein